MANPRDISSKDPDLLDIWFDTAFRNKQIEMHTSMPATIESFDAATQMAKVNLSIKRVKKNGEEIAIAPVLNVPVVFPSAGGYSITFPVSSGDEVLVVFSERSLERWKQFGGQQPPFDYRTHAYSDAVAIIGLHSKPKAVGNYASLEMQIRNANGDTVLEIDSFGKITSTAPGLFFNGNSTFSTGASGSFVSLNGQVVTVVNGLITDIL